MKRPRPMPRRPRRPTGPRAAAPAPRGAAASDERADGRVRLQKFLSDAGVASRRHAEELILDGHVLVNDDVVQTLPAFVDPARDRITVDGTLVRIQAPTYFLVHKPKGFVCTHHDPDGRPRAVDLLPPLRERLFPVGRLDAESSGLLLMTNDGELALRITHPRYGIPKMYRVEVRGRVGEDLVQRMREGVYLAEGKASATEVEIVHRGLDRSILLVRLREARNRQLRRMLARLGHSVRDLKRVQIGPITLKGLPVGAARKLSPAEVAGLREAIETAPPDATFEIRRRGRKRTQRPAREVRELRGNDAPPKRPAPPRSAAPPPPPRAPAVPREKPSKVEPPGRPRRRIVQ